MRFRSLFTLFATLAALIVGPMLGLAASATAAESPSPSSTTGTTYIYWSYWNGQADGAWTAAQAGAGSQTPADGSVIGWRWGAGQSGDINQPPRTPANFADICQSTPAESGQKRVGVVIDFGTPQVATNGQEPPANISKCVLAAPAANSLQVTSSAAAERSTPEGMVCGLNGYPSTGCGGPVSAASAAAQSTPAADSSAAPAQTASSGTSWVPFAVGIIVLIALVAGGVMIAKRRKSE